MDIEKEIVIDYRREAYKTIFNHAWFRNISGLAEGTKLDGAVFSLSINWRAAANTHALPWVMMESLGGFWDGVAKHTPTTKMVNALAEETGRIMDGKITRMKHRELVNGVRDFADRIKKKWAESPDLKADPDGIWQEFMEKPFHEFHIAIWGSQRLCFTSIFGTYENFIREVVAVAKDKPDYKVPGFKELVNDVRGHLGQDVLDKCILHQFVDTTLLVLNAILHNGGRETPELKARQHGIAVVQDILQIMAPDNELLMRELERRVLLIVETALKLPEFTSQQA